MDFCSKVAVKLLVKGVDEYQNLLTSPLSYNAILNMIAAGSSGDTLDQILQCLQHKNIQDVNSESPKLAEITSAQPKKSTKQKISDVEIELDEAPKILPKDVDDQLSNNAGLTNIPETSNPLDFLKHLNQGSFANEYLDFLEHLNQGSTANEGEAPIISFLNGVWVNQNYHLKDSFQELLQSLYKAKVENIDCEKPGLVVQEINKWASASTNGLIKEVLKEQHIQPYTTLILGNALYFKGSWEEPFKKNCTEPKSFYLLNGKEIQVPFMTGCEKYSVKSFQDFQVARIPYSSGGDVNIKFAMYIFLPNKKDGLKSLLNNVDSNPEFFTHHCDLLKGSFGVQIFLIPKFKFSYVTEESVKIMEGMGLTLPFDIEKAELSEMIKEGEIPTQQNVYVSKIIQKSFIEVNEEGTEAAAVTFSIIGAPTSCMNPPPPTRFVADHPFMFVIREEISRILFFFGVVLNPSPGSTGGKGGHLRTGAHFRVQFWFLETFTRSILRLVNHH